MRDMRAILVTALSAIIAVLSAVQMREAVIDAGLTWIGPPPDVMLQPAAATRA